MPSLKAIRKRISSVKNTQKITPATTLSANKTKFFFLSGYIIPMTRSSIATMGEAMSPAMYTWLTLANTFSKRSTIAYIRTNMATNDRAAMR